MTPFLSKRLLINVAVVVAAVGANAFVAYTQICGQRDAAERMLRSTSVRQHIDGYHLALDGALGRARPFRGIVGEPAPVNAAAGMATTLAGLERELRREFAGEPPMLDCAGRSAARIATRCNTIVDDALVKSAATTSAVSATEPDASRAWAASAYTSPGTRTRSRGRRQLAALRSEENQAAADGRSRPRRAKRSAPCSC